MVWVWALLLLLSACQRSPKADSSGTTAEGASGPTVQGKLSQAPPLEMSGSAPPAPHRANPDRSFHFRTPLPDTPVSVSGLLAQSAPVKRVRVYYSDPLPASSPYRDGGQLHAIMLSNLLRQYQNVQVSRAPISQYVAATPGQSMRDFYIGTVYGEKLPPDFIRSVQRGNAVTWLGYNLWQVPAGQLNRLGWQYVRLQRAVTPEQIRAGFTRITYKGHVYAKLPAPQEMNEVRVNPALAQTLATVGNAAGRKIPYLIRSGQVYYVADNPFQFINPLGRYLVMADSLKTMLGDRETTKCRRQALLRLEDLNAMDDPAGIRRALNVVEELKIPFAFTVIPRAFHQGQEFPLKDAPAVVEQLYRATDLGGVVVQHGYTHNYQGLRESPGNSAEEWEFWDKEHNRALAALTPDRAAQRMRAGRKVLLSLGLNPPLWTTPHYEADVGLYRKMARVYPTVLERRMYQADGVRGGQFYPYPVRDEYGALVLPENLGNVQLNFLPAQVLAAADANRNLSCPYASVFIHPYLLADGFSGADRLTQDSLRALLQGIQARGFTFVSPLDIHLRVLH